jgi:hypothetical protein
MGNAKWKPEWADRPGTLGRELKSVAPTGPATTGVQLRIELRCGFEMFNDRPYHNYETWAHGWFIDGCGVQASGEDLAKTVARFVELARKAQADEDIKPWERGLIGTPHTKPLPPK